MTPLSQITTGVVAPGRCIICGGAEAVCFVEGEVKHGVDFKTDPPVFVWVCEAHVADVNAHPLPYFRVERYWPYPGAMPELCVGCAHLVGTTCRSPDRKSNGGAGVAITYPTPCQIHIDGVNPDGSKFAKWLAQYFPPIRCASRVEVITP